MRKLANTSPARAFSPREYRINHPRSPVWMTLPRKTLYTTLTRPRIRNRGRNTAANRADSSEPFSCRRNCTPPLREAPQSKAARAARMALLLSVCSRQRAMDLIYPRSNMCHTHFPAASRQKWIQKGRGAPPLPLLNGRFKFPAYPPRPLREPSPSPPAPCPGRRESAGRPS